MRRDFLLYLTFFIWLWCANLWDGHLYHGEPCFQRHHYMNVWLSTPDFLESIFQKICWNKVTEVCKQDGWPYPPKTIQQILVGLRRRMLGGHPDTLKFMDRKQTAWLTTNTVSRCGITITYQLASGVMHKTVQDLVSCGPTSMPKTRHGRLGCKLMSGFVLAAYVIPLTLGRCNVSVTINAVNACCTSTDFGKV